MVRYKSFGLQTDARGKAPGLFGLIKNPQLLSIRQKLGLGAAGIAAFFVVPAVAVGVYGQINNENAQAEANGSLDHRLQAASEITKDEFAQPEASQPAEPPGSQAADDQTTSAGGASSSNSVNVRIESRSSSSSQDPGSNGSSSSVTVNGQTVQLPANGRLRQTIRNDDGTTRLNISVRGSNKVTQTEVND